ncbi:hypothetical protein [Pseudomonas sp.]|uniref:hypothetical protein n=1 Tax=Pseudomonas sp. TaxID=306 RepID=UPI0028A65074|nr:hypothetical protein [Pseudomonas sp.]
MDNARAEAVIAHLDGIAAQRKNNGCVPKQSQYRDPYDKENVYQATRPMADGSFIDQCGFFDFADF